MSEELSLSEQLRRAREGRGESLDQVNQRTGISLKVLRALEEGDLEAVEVVYLRLAAVHYGNYLGLDGHALAQGFEGRSKARVVRRMPRGGGPVLGGGLAKAVGVVAVAGLLGVLYLVNDGQGYPDPPVVPAPVEVPVAQEPPPAPVLSSTPEGDAAAGSAEVSAAPGDEAAPAIPGAPAGAALPPEGAVTAEPTEEAVGAQVVLQAEVLETVWVQVDWDGAGSAMETIPAGEQRTWRADRYFEVHVGRPQNIRFRFQGRLLAGGRLGEPGRTLRFRVSANGYQLLDTDFQPVGEVTEFQPERTESGQPGLR